MNEIKKLVEKLIQISEPLKLKLEREKRERERGVRKTDLESDFQYDSSNISLLLSLIVC